MMSRITATVALAVVSVALTSSAPITTTSHDMYTCKDMDDHSTREWRACSNDGDIVSYDSLNLPDKLLRNEIELFQVPEKYVNYYFY